MYTDVIFPDFGVHFIAVNDGVDSTRGENEFTAIRNVFNEMYARDTSKKIRATWQTKGKSGEHLCTNPPYGYRKDPEDKKKWIVDEEAAAIVQKAFSLCIDGLGPTQIAKWMKEHKILCPSVYWKSKGIKSPAKTPKDPYKWTAETVSYMLERVEYLGHTVNFKTTKQSYKSKKILWNDPAEWAIFENTQPPIIEESVFLIVQNIRKARRRPTKMGDMGMFSGLVYCADCGGKMYQCRATNFTEGQKYFICSTYRKDKNLCTTHSIRNVILHEIVLNNLREAIQYVTEHEAEFIQEAADHSLRDRDTEFARKREAHAKAEQRIAELDRIIARLYEYNVTGKISDKDYLTMNKQAIEELETATALLTELEEQQLSRDDYRRHIDEIRRVLQEAQRDAKGGSISKEFVDKYIDKIFVTPMEDGSMKLEIKIFTGEITQKFLKNLQSRTGQMSILSESTDKNPVIAGSDGNNIRTGHMSKKMVQQYENSLK